MYSRWLPKGLTRLEVENFEAKEGSYDQRRRFAGVWFICLQLHTLGCAALRKMEFGFAKEQVGAIVQATSQHRV